VFLKRLLNNLLHLWGAEVRQYILVAIFVGSIATAAAVTLIRTDYRNGLSEQRLDAIRFFERLHFRVETTLDGYGVLSESIAAILAGDPEMSQEEFSMVAQNARIGFPEVLNIAAAPDLVVQYVNPLEPNQSAIGLDYRNDIVTLAAIQRALRYRVPVFSGPRPLVQGGSGIIVRTPVYLDVATGGDARFWGVTAIVVELQTFLETAGVINAAEEWQVSMRRVVSSTDLGEVFYGDPALFRPSSVTDTIQFEGQAWEIAIAPLDGWLISAPNGTLILLLIASISLVLLTVALLSIRMFFERERARMRLLVAIESIHDGFVLFDDKERLVLCNDRYKEIHRDHADLLVPGQWFPGILRQSAPSSQIPDDDDRKARWIADQIAQDPDVNSVIERAGGDDTWLKVSSQHTTNGGMVELSTDITELKNAKLVAEAASEAKSEFLHLVSHELRTPLTIILGYLAFLARPEKIPANVALRKQLSDMADDKSSVEKLFDQVHANYAAIAVRAEASGKHLLALLGEILDLSMIESGEIALDEVDLPVAGVMDEIRDQFTGLASEKGLNLTVTGGNFTVFADRLRLRQILINLVGNAVKFTKQGDIRVWADTSGGDVWFHVEDTGPGILASDFEMIFQRFKQVDASSSRSEGGVGLGLSICKNLVDLHGGIIEVESEVGTGTHFKFSIPLRNAVKTAA